LLYCCTAASHPTGDHDRYQQDTDFKRLQESRIFETDRDKP
jgi:hypothetical protein